MKNINQHCSACNDTGYIKKLTLDPMHPYQWVKCKCIEDPKDTEKLKQFTRNISEIYITN